jgi:zinc/manganese transport system permease protein
LKELLVGQILWVTFDSLLPIAIISAVILTLWYLLRDRLRGLGFYALFAFAVTASMQLVGVYLVFASLIIPALATRKIDTRGIRLSCAYGVGIVGYLSRLILSTRLDMPAGAVIVWCLAAVAILFSWVVQPTLSTDTSGPRLLLHRGLPQATLTRVLQTRRCLPWKMTLLKY